MNTIGGINAEWYAVENCVLQEYADIPENANLPFCRQVVALRYAPRNLTGEVLLRCNIYGNRPLTEGGYVETLGSLFYRRLGNLLFCLVFKISPEKKIMFQRFHILVKTVCPLLDMLQALADICSSDGIFK